MRDYGFWDRLLIEGDRALRTLAAPPTGTGRTNPGATVPEAGHLAARSAYEARIEAYREASDSGDARRGLAAAHAWLLYAAEAYAAGAEHSPLLT